MPNSLKEAMACGVPVIGTSVGGIPELIDDGINGFLVPEKDARAIADCVVSILTRQVEMPEILSRARQTIEEHFDLRDLNVELENAYVRAGGAR